MHSATPSDECGADLVYAEVEYVYMLNGGLLKQTSILAISPFV